MRQLKSISTLSACLLAGVLQTFSLAPWDFWPLGLVSIVILLQTLSGMSPRQAFWHGWVFGLGLFGSGASWVYVSIHDYGHAAPALASALTALFVLFIAFFPALTFGAFNTWAKRCLITRPLSLALGFTGLWIIGDWFRTWFLTGFPWLFLGYGHLHSPLAGWIPVVGVYGVTLFSTLCAALLWVLTTHRQRALSRCQMGGIGGVILSLGVGGILLNQMDWTSPVGEPQRVVLVQGNIPQNLKWQAGYQQKSLQVYSDLSATWWGHDIIVWPETAIPIVKDFAQPFLDEFGKLAREFSTSFISGLPYREQDAASGDYRYYNSIISIGNGQGMYHKQKLVPFGEFVPLEGLLRGVIQFFDLPMSSFSVGPVDQPGLQAGALTIAPYICYEVVYPDFVQASASRADLLLTISNDSWFGDSLGPLQHLQMAQYRAKENGRFMLRGTNNGISAIIDARGDIQAQSPQFEARVLQGEARAMTGLTPFAITGS